MLKSHFSLIRGTLPSKFDLFCPKQHLGCKRYKIRNTKYVLSMFKNETVRKGFHYNLLNISKGFNYTKTFIINMLCMYFFMYIVLNYYLV